jgi:hypothetical protein
MLENVMPLIIVVHWQHMYGSGGSASRYFDFKTFLYFEPSFGVQDTAVLSTLYGQPLCSPAMS